MLSQAFPVLPRPAPEAGAAAWMDYVYLRDNPRGAYREYWHHAGGCRRWLVVERDNFTHEVFAVTDAAAGGEGAA